MVRGTHKSHSAGGGGGGFRGGGWMDVREGWGSMWEVVMGEKVRDGD